MNVEVLRVVFIINADNVSAYLYCHHLLIMKCLGFQVFYITVNVTNNRALLKGSAYTWMGQVDGCFIMCHECPYFAILDQVRKSIMMLSSLL